MVISRGRRGVTNGEMAMLRLAETGLNISGDSLAMVGSG